MKPKTIEELRESFRNADTRRYASRDGTPGEESAERWMKDAGWNFAKVDQAPFSETPGCWERLLQLKGKRCDYIAKATDGTILLLDAKLREGGESDILFISHAELQAYEGLLNLVTECFPENPRELIFMFLPRRYELKRLAFVSVEAVKQGLESKRGDDPGKEVAVTGTNGVWCNLAGAP